MYAHISPTVMVFFNYLDTRSKRDPLPWFPKAMPDGSAQLVTSAGVPIAICLDLAHARMTLDAFVDGIYYEPPLLVEKGCTLASVA
jgi:hypothetical protein